MVYNEAIVDNIWIIEELNEISPDHRGVLTDLLVEKDLGQIIQTSYDTSPIEIKTLNKINFNNKKIKEFNKLLTIKNELLDKNQDLNSYYEQLERNMEQVISDTFGYKNVIKNVRKLDPISNKIIKFNKKFRKINKAIGSLKQLKGEKRITKLIANILKNDRNITVKKNDIVDEETIKKIEKKLIRIRKNLRKRNRKEMAKEQNKTIQKAIKKARQNPRTAPRVFFQSIKSKRGENVPLTYIQSKNGSLIIGSEVKEEIKNQTQEKFNSQKHEYPINPLWFTKKFDKIKEKVEILNDNLLKEISTHEILMTFKKFKNNKTVLDNLPAEIFKCMDKDSINGIKNIFNKCLQDNDIPNKWKEAELMYIYKKGPTDLLSNFRPINMSNVLYKTFMTILNKRLSNIVEKVDLISTNQSGFRKKRSTHQRILSLMSKINHANSIGKKIYIGYLDFKGAYDSVEHWILFKILEKYGFSLKFINLLKNIFMNSSTEIITPYGKTSKVYIKRGVKQGCPLSPLLFLIFINPLIDLLNEKIIGYEKNNICSAFADDLVLVTDRFDQIERAFNIVQQFCNDTGMELNLGLNENDKSKTVYSSNDNQNEEVYIKMNNNNKRKIPFIPPNNSYSYLGVLININQNWDLQEQVLKTNLLKYLIPLRNRCFSVKQTVEAINKIFIPAIAYRLAVIPLRDKFLKQLDNIISSIIYKKLGIYFRSSKNHLFQESKVGSPNVKSLITIKKERLINTIYRIGLNGIDEELRNNIFNYQFKNNTLWFNEIKKFGFTIKKTKEIELERFRLIVWLSDDVKKITNEKLSIWNFIDNNGKIIEYKNIQLKLNHEKYELIKRDLTSNNEVKPLILYQLGMKNKIFKRSPKEVWIDGSFENNKTSFAILFDNGEYIQDILPKLNKQSNNRGELMAFLITLLSIEDEINVKIYTDSSYVKFINDKIIQNDLDIEINWDLISEIKEVLTEKIKKKSIINVIHINSHLLEKNKNIKNKEKKIKEMKEKLGEEYERILKGNQKVDILASKALKFRKYDGFFINTYRTEWCICHQKTCYDNIEDIKHIFTNQHEHLHDTKYHNNILKKYKNKEIDWTLNNKFYRSLKFSFHKSHIFNFKILFNKLKTREVVNTNENIKKRVNDLNKYNSSNCVLCEHLETIEHFLTCNLNINKLKSLPRLILKIINNASTKFNKKVKISYFPSFYWPGDKFKKYLKQENLDEIDPVMTLSGLIPLQLRKKFKELGFNNRESNYITLKIMKEISETNQKRWKKRCELLFNS